VHSSLPLQVADDDRGGGGGGGGERSAAAAAFTSQARIEVPYQAALRWQLLAGLERPHAEACALLNASEACSRMPRDARLANFCHLDRAFPPPPPDSRGYGF
jgi:hypothetical protein